MQLYKRIVVLVGVAVWLMPIDARVEGAKQQAQCAVICIGTDCNGNGLTDACDISCNNYGNFCAGQACFNDLCIRDLRCGGSSDCNGDGVLDQCQLAGNDCPIALASPSARIRMSSSLK